MRQFATNTVASVSRLTELPQFNALFDSVGLVSQIILAPGQAKDVILGFRPDVAHFQPNTVAAAPTNATDPTKLGEPQSYQGLSEHGLSSISIAESSHSSVTFPQPPSSNYALTSIDGYLNLDASVLPRADDALQLLPEVASPIDPPSTPPAGVQQLSIEFHATCCRSFFTLMAKGADKPAEEVFLDFGNQCRVGESHARECEVVNRSAVELSWRVEDLEAPFALEDIETGQTIGPGAFATVAPYSSRRIRFHLRPTEVLELDSEIVLENVGDPDNIAHIHLHAIVTSAPVEDTLVLTSDSALDFGDCCAGEWHQQIFGFTNISGAPLEVSFAPDKGLEVNFRLEAAANEALLDLDGAAIGANAVEGPPTPVDKETAAARRATVPLGASRTIIYELARSANATASRQVTTISPKLLQGERTLASSAGDTSATESSAPGSVSDAASAAPKTYLPPPPTPIRELRSPLSTNPALSAGDSSDVPDSKGSEGPRPDPLPPILSALSRPALANRADSDSGLFRVADHLKLVEQRHSANVDQIYTKPGIAYKIVVSFRPARASSLDQNGGRLVKKTFKVYVSHRPWGSRASGSQAGTKERKAIVCKARVCTSFVAVRPDTIDFGEVELGTPVHATLSITNLSEIAARVDLRFISKVLSAYRDEMEIDPGQTIDVRVDFIPRRVNQSYAKQISIHNLRNPHDSSVCLVKAVNVDTRGMAFHSRFYKLLTPTGGNFCEFGTVPVHGAAWRAITVQNTSPDALALELAAAHPEEYQLFLRKAEPVPAVDGAEQGQGRITEVGAEVAPCTPPKGATKTESVTKGELKERVLDAMMQPGPVRTEPPAPSAPSSSTSLKAAQENAVNQLKEGLKAQPTLAYGSTMGFKDKSLLSAAEYLDLATGPPSRRTISPKTKRTLFLDPSERAAKLKPSKLSFQTRPLLPNSINTAPIAVDGEGRPARPRRPTPPPLANLATPAGGPPVTPTKQHRKPSRKPDGQSNTSSSASSPALTGRRKTKNVLVPTDPSKMSLEQALAALESHEAHPDSSELTTWQAEDTYVRNFIALRKVLKNAIAAGDLYEASTVDVPANSERTVYILVHPAGTRSTIGPTSRKQEGTISLRLASFGSPSAGAELPALGSSEIPTREVVLRWTTCRMLLELGMAHINFGQLEKGASKTKKLVLDNRSDKPLLYAVRKSGSIASGDLRLPEGRHGVIEGYGKREVSVIFEPHFAGTFEETMHVDVVEDDQEGQSVRVKAYITKPPTFAVSVSSLDFGSCACDALSGRQTVSVTNLSANKRTFTVSVAEKEFLGAKCAVQVILDPSGANLALPNLTAEEEEEVESVLQKLKIARRKGQAEKETKYVARLTLLGVPVPPADALATMPTSPVDPQAASPGGQGGATSPAATGEVGNVGQAGAVPPLLALPLPSIPLPVPSTPFPTPSELPVALVAKPNGATLAPPGTAPLTAGSSRPVSAVSSPGSTVSAASAALPSRPVSKQVTFTLEPHSRRDLAVVIRPALAMAGGAEEGVSRLGDVAEWVEEIRGKVWVTENADSRSAVELKMVVNGGGAVEAEVAA